MTTNIEVARAYAGEYVSPANGRIDGALYRVKPRGRVAEDEDFPFDFPAIAVAGRAKIVEVVEARVAAELNPRVLARAIAPFKRMKGSGAPVYDEDGYLVPTVWLDYGATPQQLQALGPWIPLHVIPQGARFAMPRRLPPVL